MEKKSIYKIGGRGQHLIWSIWVEGNAESATDPATIRIQSGQIGGKIKDETPIVITSGKNLGKKNATTPYTQAVSDAENKVEKKLRGEYRPTLEECSQGVLRSGIAKPMLAHKYDPTMKQSNSKDLDKMKVRGLRAFLQPKYDGYRCETMVDEEAVRFFTREGDESFVIPHIAEQLRAAYIKAKRSGKDTLDGELYTADLTFNTLGGLLRAVTRTPEEEEQIKQVKYYLYDTYSDEGYEKRYEVIKQYESENVLITPNTEVELQDDILEENLHKFLEQGNEGMMIRLLDKPYEHKRSWGLCKVKLFEDEEFEIVDFELNSQGRLGGVIVKMHTPSTDRNGKVISEFRAGLGKGINHEEGMKIYNNRAEHIGKMATIEFFGRSEYGVPRHPKFKAVRKD